jgi:predicted permease
MIARARERPAQRRTPPTEIIIGAGAQICDDIHAVDALFTDARYACRRLLGAPTFSVFTLILLALAIGANTGIFSLLEGLTLRNLPVRHPEQLVQLVSPSADDPDRGITLSEFREVGRRQHVFSEMLGAASHFIATVDISGQLSQVMTSFVTGNFYEALGVRPAAGRLFSEEDDPPSGGLVPVAVISFEYWLRQFHGDPSTLGRTIRVDGFPFVIVGVAPTHFSGTELSHEPDLMIPHAARFAIENAMGLDPTHRDPDVATLTVVGRLNPGITLAQADAQLNVQWTAVKQASVPTGLDADKRAEFLAQPLVVKSAMKGTDPSWRSSVADPLWLAMAGAAAMLVIACLNLAGLMLARVAVGLHEWDVRAALGATRWRLARPVLIECLLLTGLGACCGFPLATWSIAAFRRWTLSGVFPMTSPLSLVPDLRVFAFVTVTVLLVGLLVSAGAIAWLRTRHRDVSMRSGARATRQPIGPLLVTVQIALSLTLVATSALLARNLQGLRATDGLHYRRDGVTVISLEPRPNGYSNLDKNTYQPELVDKLLAVPGVRAASLGYAPAPKFWVTAPVSPKNTHAEVTALIGDASPGFFRTLDLPLLRGRDFTWRDDSHASPVAIVSQSVSRRFFGDGGALGQRVRVGTEAADQDIEVVGIVTDAKLYDFLHPTPFAVYLPLLQRPDGNWKDALVRSDLPAGVLGPQLRGAVDSLGHEFARRIQTLTERTDSDLNTEWLIVELAACFSALALILTAVGLYALLSYAVAARRRELGIRLALGAQPRRLLVAVTVRGLRITATGIVLGAGGIWITSRLLASTLPAVRPSDPLVLVVSPIVLFVVAGLACLGPARKAVRIDPIAVLRMD